MAKIHKLTRGANTIYPATIPQAVVDPTSGKSARTELDERANHGYESNPKTLKEVDDSVSQLAGNFQKVLEFLQIGYWVHKDTGVRTYFGLDDPSIEDGIMSTPSWKNDCSEVKLPLGVTGLGEECFSYCRTSLLSITLPEGVTSIGRECFAWCESLTSITLPESVTSLGDICFAGCTSFTSITLPVGVTIIGDGCFSECYALTSINIPEGVTSLEDTCFLYCESLTSITLPESVTSLGESCFEGCTSLTSISIPESVNSIGTYCFMECSSLTLATVLPAIPPSLGADAFDYTHSSFNIQVRSPYVDDYKAASGWIEFADKISAIGAGYWVHKDTGVKTYFGADADFITAGLMSAPSWGEDCSEVKIPLGVTGLDYECFAYCSSLTSITLPVGFTGLGEYCFSGCTSLDSITLPVGFTGLGEYCFSGCSSLTLATVLPAIPPTLGEYAFDGVHPTFNIQVRPPYVDDYKAASGWIEFASKIFPIA